MRAHALKRQEHVEEMWLMGQHIMSALDATVCNCMPFVKRSQKGQYLEEPMRIIPLTEEEKAQKEEEALKQAISFFGALEQETNQKGK